MKTKTNKIPLVGPRGRQEILKKVEQIAQQDYLRIFIADLTAPKVEERAELRKCVQNDTIWDVIIESAGGVFGRVLGVDKEAFEITIYNAGNSAYVLIDYNV